MSETRLRWQSTLDLPKECDYIVERALAGQNAMVLTGCLMFLALANGDAFALDLDDRFACPLCLEGERQRYPLLDTGKQWAFQWPWRYFVARGRIHFDRTDGGGFAQVQLAAGTIERQLKAANQRVGTNYHL
jgi:hypothetical protein